MNRKSNTSHTNQPGKQLKEGEGFHRVRPLARLWIVVLFLALGVVLPLSRSVHAQGVEGHHLASKALKARTGHKRASKSRGQAQNIEGAIVTAKQVKLKRGYKFIKLGNNTIAVAKPKKGSGGTVITGRFRCMCKGGEGVCEFATLGGNTTVCAAPQNSQCQECMLETIITSTGGSNSTGQ